MVLGKFFLGLVVVAVGLALVVLLRRLAGARLPYAPASAVADTLAHQLMLVAVVFGSLMLAAGAAWARCRAFTTSSRRERSSMCSSTSVLSSVRRLAGSALAGIVLAGQALAGTLPSAVEAERFEVGQNVYVRALAVDPARQSMWVGTSVGALEIELATRDVRRVFTRQNGLGNEYVFGIGVSPDGEVWFGTNGGGTSRWNDGTWKTFMPMHGLADYWVYTFSFDDRGRAWIGTWDGANLYDPATDKWTTYHDELVNIWVYGSDIDAAGRVWLGTEGGVSMFDNGVWRSWTHEDGLGAPNRKGLPASHNTGLGTRQRHDLSVYVDNQESYNPSYVFDVLVDQTGRGIWFGIWGGGVSLFDGDSTWTNYTDRDGLPGNIVYSIAQDADGILWFGTNNGVVAFDGESFRTYHGATRGQHIYDLAVAPDGAIWAGTRGAVIRLIPKE